jgi:hypothetical protein
MLFLYHCNRKNISALYEYRDKLHDPASGEPLLTRIMNCSVRATAATWLLPP